MRNNRKKLLYVSGPPCAGKSTISNELTKRMQSIQYILGDQFWIQNEGNDFDLRIKKTNQDIIAILANIESSRVLLEWVPSDGAFVDNIKSICSSKEYEFVHIVITAPKGVLEKRKLTRDGNMDLGPVELEKYLTMKNVVLFDTSIESIDTIVNKCMNILE